MTIDKIPILRSYIKSFVAKANRLIERESWYEPPLGKSHIWANLKGVVEMANDVLEDFPE